MAEKKNQDIFAYKNRDYPFGYKFNLPPHAWSLAVPTGITEALPGRTRTGVINRNTITDKDRRGKLWRYARLADLEESDSSVNPAKYGPNIGRNPGAAIPLFPPKTPPPVDKNKEYQSQLNEERKKTDFGFQFLWNPTKYQASVGVSQNVTPAASDSLAFLNLFQGTGSLTFEIQINRVNDFACFKSTSSRALLLNYYGTSYGEINAEMVDDLMNRGTLSDIEYLYKAINGSNLRNVANKDTADIGIIIPTLMRVDIGPYSQVGIIASLTISHELFTQSMIPIVSNVSINMQLLSSYGFGVQGDKENNSNAGDSGAGKTAPKGAARIPKNL